MIKRRGALGFAPVIFLYPTQPPNVEILKIRTTRFSLFAANRKPNGFRLISPMKFDESKDKTQKYDDAKSAHRITSFQLKIYSTRPGSNLIPSQIEKINKRSMMITTNISPLSFVSFIDLLDNSHRTNNIIKLPPPPFIFQ